MQPVQVEERATLPDHKFPQRLGHAAELTLTVKQSESPLREAPFV